MDKLLRSSVIILFLLAASCGKTVEQRLQAIDGMQGVLTNVTVTSEEVDEPQIDQYLKDIKGKSARVRMEFVFDSLDQDDQYTVLEFDALSSRLEQALAAKEKVVSSVKKTRLNLADLRTDVQNNKWPEDSLNLYLDIEFQYVMELDETLEEVLAQVNGCFQTYEQINPRIEELLSDSLTL